MPKAIKWRDKHYIAPKGYFSFLEYSLALLCVRARSRLFLATRLRFRRMAILALLSLLSTKGAL